MLAFDAASAKTILMRRKKTLPCRIMAPAELSDCFARAFFAMQKRRLKSKMFGNPIRPFKQSNGIALFRRSILLRLLLFLRERLGQPSARRSRPNLPFARDFAPPRPIARGGRRAKGRRPVCLFEVAAGIGKGERLLDASARLAADSQRFRLGRGGNGGGRFRCALKRRPMGRGGQQKQKRPGPGSGRLRVAGGQAPPPLLSVGVTLLRPLRLRPRR